MVEVVLSRGASVASGAEGLPRFFSILMVAKV